jgi:hypothetical protein
MVVDKKLDVVDAPSLTDSNGGLATHTPYSVVLAVGVIVPPEEYIMVVPVELVVRVLFRQDLEHYDVEGDAAYKAHQGKCRHNLEEFLH